MWEFPHHALADNESPAAAAIRLLRQLGIEGDVGHEIAAIRHSVTRFRITMTCLGVAHCRGAVPAGLYPDLAWVRPDELHAYPLSAPQRRLAQELLANGEEWSGHSVTGSSGHGVTGPHEPNPLPEFGW